MGHPKEIRSTEGRGKQLKKRNTVHFTVFCDSLYCCVALAKIMQNLGHRMMGPIKNATSLFPKEALRVLKLDNLQRGAAHYLVHKNGPTFLIALGWSFTKKYQSLYLAQGIEICRKGVPARVRFDTSATTYEMRDVDAPVLGNLWRKYFNSVDMVNRNINYELGYWISYRTSDFHR